MSVYTAPLEEDIMDDYKTKEDLGKCPKCGRLGCECDPETCECEPNSKSSDKLRIDFE
mgnify:FL=1